jgi:hypothetical protein
VGDLIEHWQRWRQRLRMGIGNQDREAWHLQHTK